MKIEKTYIGRNQTPVWYIGNKHGRRLSSNYATREEAEAEMERRTQV